MMTNKPLPWRQRRFRKEVRVTNGIHLYCPQCLLTFEETNYGSSLRCPEHKCRVRAGLARRRMMRKRSAAA